MEKIRPDSTMLHLLAQAIRFGIVGFLVTVVHIVVFIGCIEILNIAPLWANFPAFMVALASGFIGHFTWTFRIHCRGFQYNWKALILKFLLVSFVGLGLNTLVVYLVVNLLGHPYMYAVLLMVSVVPAIMFLLQKYWTFK